MRAKKNDINSSAVQEMNSMTALQQTTYANIHKIHDQRLPSLNEPPSTSTLLPSSEPHYNFSHIVQKEKLYKVFQPTFLGSDYHFTSHSYAWCQEQFSTTSGNNDLLKNSTGLIYNKMPKAASSTIASVTGRIARYCLYRKQQMQQQLNVTTSSNTSTGTTDTSTNTKSTLSEQRPTDLGITYHFKNHPSGIETRTSMNQRNKHQSFLFSSIRHPVSRGMSRIFYTMISKHGKDSTDENVLSFLRKNKNAQMGTTSKGQGGFQTWYLSLQPIDEDSAYSYDEISDSGDTHKHLNQTRVIEIVQQIMIDYDFILLVERLDECLVLMQLMLGMDTTDILYLSSKVAGSYFSHRNKCIKIQKTFKSSKVSNYLASKEWYTESFGDYLLMEAVNKSIDLTIDRAVGRQRFEEALEKYQSMIQDAEESCASEAVFPCSLDGTYQMDDSIKDCYFMDEGCGYRCLDSYMYKREQGLVT